MTNEKQQIEHIDSKDAFRRAYENRYTWNSTFQGYEGKCSLERGGVKLEGSFKVNKDLKLTIDGFQDKQVEKLITSQLWEVTIHRVERSFESVHGDNTFSYGNSNNIGLEIILGGKSKGDSYRIKDDVVTMVNRHIHGKLIQIYTNKIINTESGYLSKDYSSQYFDSKSKKPISGITKFSDTFIQLTSKGPWVLSKRISNVESFLNVESSELIYSFTNLTALC